MKSLNAYLDAWTGNAVNEGGAAGHLSHPYDYTDFTLRDIKGLIRNLFTGKVEGITEKVDGTNIQATVNDDGDVRFIRNKSDLANGGMTLQGMADKWASKPEVRDTFVTAGETIEKVLKKVAADKGSKFFNPDKETRIYANCECVKAGKTNIMPYVSSQVDFHDLWVYKKTEGGWECSDVTTKGLDIISKACEGIDEAKLTPKVIISMTHESDLLMLKKIKEIDKVFKDTGCGEMSTIHDYLHAQFTAECLKSYKWMQQSPRGMEALFSRWFDGDKTTDIRKICDMYKEAGVDASEVRDADKRSKELTSTCNAPLDKFFIGLGNSVIKLCKGLINTGAENDAIKELEKDMNDVVSTISSSSDDEAKTKLLKQLDRIGDESINATEGIVFRYKGRMMKLTGTFAPLNMLLNLKHKFK